MRLLSWSSSSPPIRFLVAAISDSSASMASRPPLQYRGGRYHMNRGYCDRSAFGEGDNVAEISHQGSGRDLNSGFRQVDGGGYVDNRNYNNVSWRGQFIPRPQFQQNRPPYYHQNQSFNGKPGFIYNAPMNTRPGPILDSSYVSHGQPMYVNQQRGPNQSRPRNSKPLDFREWEYAKPEPPRHWERFTILSYNILADYLANDHWRKLYFHIPRHMLSWEWRKTNLFFELRLWSPDIMCFQEVDRFQELAVEFKRQGYDGIYKMRTGNPVDGCSVFWRTSKFKLLHEESIEFNKLGLRDNVAQICVLESVQRIQMENLSVSGTSSAGSNRVVVCNIHVLFNPKRGDIKIGQVRVLFEKAHAVSKAWNNAPIVVCGDFNCTPKSPLYNYIVEQKLELSELARDKVSGQTSAEIQAPIFYSPNPGVQVPMNITPSTRYVGLNSDAEKSDSQLDSQKQITTSEPADNLPSQTQHVHEDEPDETVTSEGDLNSVDLDGVLNELKSTPPSSPGPNVASLKSNMIETENSMDHSIPHAESLDEISSPEPSSGGTMHTEDNIHQRGEETGHATETSHISHSAPSEASSSFETIYDDPAKSLGENEDIGEDGETFLSELTRDSLNLDYNQPQTTHTVEEHEKHNLSPESEPFSQGRTAYNPSLWTPTEIETATGNADCTSLEHPLKLSSTYSETEDLLGTRDANGEPLITSYHRCFCGTVDYIWRSEGIRTVRVLSPMRKQAMQWTAGFPTKKWGSDHIALVAQLAFVEEAPEQDDKRDQ
ncbi:unnamed protein product [Rhodiola kirilowii]